MSTPEEPLQVPSMPVPSVGRIVHYTALGRRTGTFMVNAAIITEVEEDGMVDLTIFAPGTTFRRNGISFTTAKAGTEEAAGRWAWPERV